MKKLIVILALILLGIILRAIWERDHPRRRLPGRILMVRERLQREDLERMNGRQLFELAVNAGWIGRDSVQRLSLGEVSVQGATAFAQVDSGRSVSTPEFKLRFQKQSGVWKFDLISLMAFANQALVVLATRQGVSPHEFALSLVEAASGSRPSEEILQPPR